MNALERLMWVHNNMPDECELALNRFVRGNPSWNGADWIDCLDVLLDSDSHLELEETLWAEAEAAALDKDVLPLVCPIGVTLLYASGGVAPTLADVRVVLEQQPPLEQHLRLVPPLEPWNA